MGEIRVGRRVIKTSSEDRVLFPRDGITKGEIVEYYRAIAPFMIPHVRKRRLTMQRFQPNIDATPVFQKDMPEHFPEWVPRTVSTEAWRHGHTRRLRQCRNAGLHRQSRLSDAPRRPAARRQERVSRPDGVRSRPPSDDFGIVRDVAFQMRDLLQSLGLASFLKTTGSRGLHLVTPLDRKLPFDDVHAIAHAISAEMARRDPDHVTTEFYKKNRGERLFLDANRNATAQTAVPAFAVRAKDGAPIAMPISWEELKDLNLHARTWTVRNAVDRMKSIEDPWKGFAKAVRSLRPIRTRLGANPAPA